ncbi:AzlC family ABC transporter permease [Neobacillus dielmonensis]|uniref:AzlC family ABC transporter permease n=1 Tax=Neobacillus dielmonensis TaxID=1347369 RepID=UPI0005A95B15|nr:AzlC family ABC transporter permease [Neobacillus dielmonensis]
MGQVNAQMETIPAPQNSDTFIQGVKDCIPTLLGYLSIGFAAGVVEKTAGLSIAEIVLLSFILYAGSAQFIAAGMIAVNSSAMAIIITVFFVNLRHILLSAALSPYFRHLSPLKNMLIGTLLTDETFGVAINKAAEKKAISERWMQGLNLTAWINWVVANIAGAYFGNWISNPEKFGLNYALPAMFIGLLVLSMISRRKIVLDIIVGVLAIVIAVGVSMMFSSSLGVILATIFASTIGMVIEKWK